MRQPPEIHPDPPPPDRLAVIVRGVCGALLGTGLGCRLWFGFHDMGRPATIATFAVAIVGCAWGAIRYGDAFWWNLFGRR